ncbi:hypothetical protein ACWKWU_20235 [Chitinophaga lutea]
MQKAYTPLVLLACMAMACKKEGSTTASPAPHAFSVEGVIEDGRYPLVVIRREAAPGTYVEGATVTVSNGAMSHQLRAYRFADGLYAYTLDTAHLSSAFTGVAGSSYTLQIEAEGHTLSAITAIPARGPQADSLWTTGGNRLMVRLKGDGTEGRYLRCFIARNKGAFHATPVADRASMTGKLLELPLAEQFAPGDTLTLKCCNIDHNTYDFWYNADRSLPTYGAGNIRGGAAGSWGGYRVTYTTTIIPK